MKIAIVDNIRLKQSLSFLYRSIIFIIILFVLDFAIGNILKYYFFSQKSGFYYRTTYSIENTKADVLIFGASKANHQFYPEIFEKRLNLTYYNVGRDGSSIFYHYAILKSVLKRYLPKVIILDITREFERKQSSYDRISMLLPYYNRHPEFLPIIELKSRYEKLKLNSKIYPYNSLVFSIISGNSKSSINNNQDIKGYIPLYNVWNEPIRKSKSPGGDDIDSTKIIFFESFIKDCVKSNIKLYIIVSPDYIKYEDSDRANSFAKQIALKYDIKFYDFSQDSLFLNNGRYFADLSHLNNDGAKVFSNLVVDKIVPDYQNYFSEH